MSLDTLLNGEDRAWAYWYGRKRPWHDPEEWWAEAATAGVYAA